MNNRYRSRTANVNAAVWLIGLGILWLTNLWWPGILILVGLSMLVQVLVSSGIDKEPAVIPSIEPAPASASTEKAENSSETEKEDVWRDDKAEIPAFIQQKKLEGDASRLPQKCPACGGPIAENAHNVEWLGDHTARCPFCSTVISLY